MFKNLLNRPQNFKQYEMEHHSDNFIALKDCQKGKIYRIHARNFSIGVFDGKYGFIGIREKFNNIFLEKEFHWNVGSVFLDMACYGTVKPFEVIGILPHSINPTENLKHSNGNLWAKDQNEFIKPIVRHQLLPNGKPHGERRGFVDFWVDTQKRLPDDTWPFLRENKKLFDFLMEFEQHYQNKR